MLRTGSPRVAPDRRGAFRSRAPGGGTEWRFYGWLEAEATQLVTSDGEAEQLVQADWLRVTG